MRIVITTMKRLRDVTLLTAVIGFALCQKTQQPIYAAANPARPGSQAVQTAASPATEMIGAEAYATHCAICHGEHREGVLPAFPPLLGIDRQMTDQQITE